MHKDSELKLQLGSTSSKSYFVVVEEFAANHGEEISPEASIYPVSEVIVSDLRRWRSRDKFEVYELLEKEIFKALENRF